MWQAVDIEKWVEERRSGISGVKEPVEDIIRMVREDLATWKGGKPEGSAQPAEVRGKPTSKIVIEERR